MAVLLALRRCCCCALHWLCHGVEASLLLRHGWCQETKSHHFTFAFLVLVGLYFRLFCRQGTLVAGAVLQHRFQVIIPAWVLTVPPCANHKNLLSLRNVKYYPNFATRGDGCQVESCWIWFFRRNKQAVYFSFLYLITSCPLEISILVVPVQAEPP